ncbi:DNA/RNA non-specific endonuclease [Microbacterium rhizomatis]|uniref:DNA/RNA non-specific endonuclease n=1 Tax=Microbacterium rhizomatis TaxID=1631477 RepID=A0A5J5J7U2_9MICO|nr:DNA/RNA non-specific endonuclease [Microbacterium rhizomatis]KAA9111055.1 DNA/RNA non-specific endonuclease [Microbacterium rhizomatis]
MTDYPGYDEAFLGIPLPLPRPADARPARELTYPHFSVTLDPARRLAVVTGVNIDGPTVQDLPRTGTWDYDPRVPEDEQTGPGVYADNDLDRGHLVRRRDPGWGDAATAKRATDATFVFTNAAPQAARFNQSKELWLGLEDHVLAYAQTQGSRISVFTAPVLACDDPPYRGIRIPRRFWKVAAWATGVASAPLAAAGFVLDQSHLIDTTLAKGVTVVPLGGFRTFQVPVGDIAVLAGIDVGALAAADVLTAPTAAARAPRELNSLADVIL